MQASFDMNIYYWFLLNHKIQPENVMAYQSTTLLIYDTVNGLCTVTKTAQPTCCKFFIYEKQYTYKIRHLTIRCSRNVTPDMYDTIG